MRVGFALLKQGLTYPRLCYAEPRVSFAAPRPCYTGPRVSFAAPRPCYTGPRVWKTLILPLNYRRLGDLLFASVLVHAGIEPATLAFHLLCKYDAVRHALACHWRFIYSETDALSIDESISTTLYQLS